MLDNMQKRENIRARQLAHNHAQKTASLLEEVLYFIYSHIIDDYEPSNIPTMRPSSVNVKESVEKEPAIDAVALFVNVQKGKYLMDYLNENPKLNSSLSRDLFSNTEYMWCGSVDSRDFISIVRLVENNDGGSDIPQMDFFIVLVPIGPNIEKKGIKKDDSSNRVSFFMNICQNNCDIRLSKVLNHKLLPTDLLYIK